MSEPEIPLAPIVPETFRPIEVIVVRPSRPRYWLHLLLLLLTFLTTSIVGAQLQTNFDSGLPVFRNGDGFIPLFPIEWLFHSPKLILRGIPFSLTLMLILLTHEMGHYLTARRYNVSATLPFFIPAPTLIGTLGAFIRIKSRIRSRTALLDIGIAGPIAGFVLAVPAAIIGLLLSRPVPPLREDDISLGFPLIFHFLHGVLGALSPLLRAHPLSILNLHPVAIAAWVGMLATALNLLPGGQLDGGHIIYSAFPRAHKYISLASILVLVPFAFVSWAGWIVWAVMLGLTGLRHPNVPAAPGLSRGRRRLALLAILMLILTFIPAPFNRGSVAAILQDSGVHVPFVNR
jgi:membrane-associated protease RseP (regulator of RpoE activity)